MTLSYSEKKEQISILLNKAFSEFRKAEVEKGNPPPSQACFAAWLGIPPTIYSYCSNRILLPTIEQADAIAIRLGPEIYKILEMSMRIPDDPQLYRLLELWHKLSEDQKRQIMEEVTAWVQEEKSKEMIDPSRG
jgi:hypothetical protein